VREGVDANFISDLELDQTLKSGKIGRDLIIIGHGSVVPKGSNEEHKIFENEEPGRGREVFEVLSSLPNRADYPASGDRNVKEERIDVYLSGCGDGILKDRFKPDNPLWNKMN
jgi:hypothetical protein